MEQLIALLVSHGAWLVLGVTFAARVGLPVPAAPLLVVTGGLIAAGTLAWPAVFLASVVANLVGDAVWFWAGRVRGHRIMRLLCRVSLSPDACVRQSESLIARWGGSSLVAAKFLPGISVVAAPMAGALGMPLPRFIGFDLAAGAIWTGFFLYLGHVFSDQITDVLAVLANAGGVATALLAVAIALWLGARYLRRRALVQAATIARIGVAELHHLLRSETQPLVLDVRSPTGAALDDRRIPGALQVTLKDLPQLAPTLPRDRDIVVYCNCPNEVSAVQAARILARHGVHRTRPLAGGLDAWAEAGHPLESGA